MSKPPAGPATSPIDGEIRKVSSLIETAQHLLSEHKMVDMAALRDKVETLCRTIEEVKPEDAERVIRAITEITRNLDTLSAALTFQNESVTAQSRGATGMQASAAYNKGKKES